MIVSRSPLRISFVGGGSDLKNFLENNIGKVISTSINMYTYCFIKKSTSLIIENLNTKNKITITNVKKNKCKDFIFIIYKYIMDNFNNQIYPKIDISYYSDVPEGSGLGGSSSLITSVISSLLKLIDFKVNKKELADLAIYIERQILLIPGGIQDQFASIYGGLNKLIFTKNKNYVQKIKLNKNFKENIQNSLVLIYVKRKIKSDIIINNQNNLININHIHFKKMTKLVDIFEKNLKNSNYNQIYKIINQNWHLKKKTSSKISNKLIEKIIHYGVNHNAKAIKMSGAGGGGYMFMMIPNIKDRINFKIILKDKMNLKCQFIKFENEGSCTWIN